MPNLRSRHAPGHVREAARDAMQAWTDWDGALPEPTIEYEVKHVVQEIPISRALGLVCSCTDIVPSDVFDDVEHALGGYRIMRRTYAACAQAILRDMKADVAN